MMSDSKTELNQNTYKGLKIIHAGFHRTGSASLSIALDILGYGPVWHMATYPTKYPTECGKALMWWLTNKLDLWYSIIEYLCSIHYMYYAIHRATETVEWI